MTFVSILQYINWIHGVCRYIIVRKELLIAKCLCFLERCDRVCTNRRVAKSNSITPRAANDLL